MKFYERSVKMKQINLDIGNRIKHYRELRNMTQEELAQKVGYVNKSSIYSIEKGMAAVPYDKLTAITKVLNVSEFVLRYGENPSMVDIMLKENSIYDKESSMYLNEPTTDYSVKDDDRSITFTVEMLEQIPFGDVKKIMEYYNRLKR